MQERQRLATWAAEGLPKTSVTKQNGAASTRQSVRQYTESLLTSPLSLQASSPCGTAPTPPRYVPPPTGTPSCLT